MKTDVKTTRGRIKALRIERNLTQTGLEMAVHFPEKSISKIETGERNLSLDEATILANYFGVSVSYLSCETDDRQLNVEANLEELGVAQIRAVLNRFPKDAQIRILTKLHILYR
ncbi:helix-turn-helix transcriptional regulator [Enterocloster bolteae]|uniref:helix-turn-helix domain-containing protein n=1 Tax=Enterocloster bolteae TaxID=208479 RepID=UPI002A7FB96A|nr:helix-turn-helix transcriptional regulator [Enterocloster bolteae]